MPGGVAGERPMKAVPYADLSVVLFSDEIHRLTFIDNARWNRVLPQPFTWVVHVKPFR